MSSAKNDEKMTVIHWFRKGLRLHDNPALLAGLQKVNGELLELRPVFILDPWFVKHACVGVNRWRFLIQSLENLDKNLKERGSRLFLIRGKPEDVFEKIFKEWRVKRLTYENDTEPYAKMRDAVVEEIARKHQVEIVKKVSHTLYDLERIVKVNGGAAPLTYQKFQSVIGKLGNPETSLPAPKSFPDACKTTLSSDEYDVPKLEDLGIDLSNLGPNLYPGGESEALDRLEKYMKKQDWVCKFSKPDTSPNSISPSTTVLSPYLKFGCLSPRLMFQQVQQVIQGRTHTSPPTSLIGQLYWREFFYTAAAYTPNFDRMEGNPICKQIPWENNPEFLEAWKHGRTGYPFIDAIMTQLRTEGWIHHLARHAVACFLTRGDLWISWVDGVKVFEEFLLDADWSLNAANWMWLSASAFFHQYFRVYSPVVFGKKTDKHGDYIKKYLPILKKFPAEYIYEPWKAPLSVQKAAGCIIGKDYPKPIVDHDVVSKRNMQRMGAAYKGAAAVKEPAAEKPAAKRKAKDPDNSAKGKTAKITAFLKKK